MSRPHTSSYDVQLCISLLRATPTFRLTSRKRPSRALRADSWPLQRDYVLPYSTEELSRGFPDGCVRAARTILETSDRVLQLFCKLAKGHTQNDQASRNNASTRGVGGVRLLSVCLSVCLSVRREYRQRGISRAHPDLCTASTRSVDGCSGGRCLAIALTLQHRGFSAAIEVNHVRRLVRLGGMCDGSLAATARSRRKRAKRLTMTVAEVDGRPPYPRYLRQSTFAMDYEWRLACVDSRC
jgi:hypothetical protein